jgi:hypothetical protein
MIGSVSSGFRRRPRLNATITARHAVPIPIPAGKRRSPPAAPALAWRTRACSAGPWREPSNCRSERVDTGVAVCLTLGADRGRLCGRFADFRRGTATPGTSAVRTFANLDRPAFVAATAVSTLEARTGASSAGPGLTTWGEAVAVPSPAEAWALSASAGAGSAALASGCAGGTGPATTASAAASADACSAADRGDVAETTPGGKNASGSTYPCSSLVVRRPK